MSGATDMEQQEGLIICAWCQKVMGSKAGITKPTHSICGSCKDIHFPQIASQEEEEIGPRMNILCLEGDDLIDDLVAVEGADHLSNSQLKTFLDHQRDLGRNIAFELVW